MATSSGRAGRTSWSPCCSCSDRSSCPKLWLRSVFHRLLSMLSVIRSDLQPLSTCPCCAGLLFGFGCPLLFNDGTLCSSGGGLFRAKRQNFSSTRGNAFKSVSRRQLSISERVMRYVIGDVPASSFLLLCLPVVSRQCWASSPGWVELNSQDSEDHPQKTKRPSRLPSSASRWSASL